MARKNIVITGGAGFIGSHTSVELLDAGYDIAIIDNFSYASYIIPSVAEGIIKKCKNIYIGGINHGI